MNEQARDEKHAGHEEAVIEQHDEVEAEPARVIAIAEISVIDDRVMQHHQQRDAGSRAVKSRDAHRRRRDLIISVWISAASNWSRGRFGSLLECVVDHLLDRDIDVLNAQMENPASRRKTYPAPGRPPR